MNTTMTVPATVKKRLKKDRRRDRSIAEQPLPPSASPLPLGEGPGVRVSVDDTAQPTRERDTRGRVEQWFRG